MYFFIHLAAISSNRENKNRVNYEFQLFRVSLILVLLKKCTKAALARSVLNKEHSSLYFCGIELILNEKKPF